MGRRVFALGISVSVVAALVGYLALRRAGASPVSAILGCWEIVSTEDSRYPVGDSVCLHPDGMVVLSRSEDAWPVTWKAKADGWRAHIPPEEADGAQVDFFVTPEKDGELSFRTGGGWMALRLGHRLPLRGEEALRRVRACHACLWDTLQERPQAGGLLGGPAYTLRACMVALETIHARCLPEVESLR